LTNIIIKKYIINMQISCHLWKKSNLSKQELMSELSEIKVYEESSNFIRKLLACTECGQLYFYEFLEFRDYEDGEDPMYSTWVPVLNEIEADQFLEKSSEELLKFPSLRWDFPKGVSQPGPVYRVF
jgi:hypothetical protein